VAAVDRPDTRTLFAVRMTDREPTRWTGPRHG
jgi:hypothetical protein